MFKIVYIGQKLHTMLAWSKEENKERKKEYNNE